MQTFSLSYAKADRLMPLLTKSALSARGQIQVDTRTNTLIMTDLPDRLQTAQALITTLDRPEPQVEVEARVVQTTREFARAIGVQWGFNGRANSELGNTTAWRSRTAASLGGRVGATVRRRPVAALRRRHDRGELPARRQQRDRPRARRRSTARSTSTSR